MRTKTLLLTAALTVAAAATSMAQAVYSVNIVGYVNKAIPAGFSMVANQLNASPDNKVTTVLATPPEGTEIYKFVNGAYVVITYFGGAYEAEDPNNLNMTLAPGEGVFVNSPSAFTATLVGEVKTGVVNVDLPPGFNIRSSAIPQSGGLQSVLGFPPVENDEVYQWTGAAFALYTYIAGGWESDAGAGEPTIAIGESFFVNSAGAPGRLWTRNFVVGP